MLHILIAGGVNENDKDRLPQLEEFAQLLGKEIIAQGHILLNACRTSFDRVVAESANATVMAIGGNPTDRIISYVLLGMKPAHKLGMFAHRNSLIGNSVILGYEFLSRLSSLMQ